MPRNQNEHDAKRHATRLLLAVALVAVLIAFPFVWARYLARVSIRIVNDSSEPVTALFTYGGKIRVYKDIPSGRSGPRFWYRPPDNEGAGPLFLVRSETGQAWCGGGDVVDPLLSINDAYVVTADGRLSAGEAGVGRREANCPRSLLALEEIYARPSPR